MSFSEDEAIEVDWNSQLNDASSRAIVLMIDPDGTVKRFVHGVNYLDVARVLSAAATETLEEFTEKTFGTIDPKENPARG